VAKRLTKDSIILASELDDSAVKTGTEIAKIGNFTNVQFIQRDLRALRLGEKFDQVLAIDVLEHIDDDLSALKEINGVLKSDGMLIISVPTPLYPKYFGREFADRIGHVRDGYFLEDITRKLDSTGFRVLKHKYYTRRWASLFCSFFYKTRIPTPKIRYIGPIIAISYFYLKLALFPFMKWLAIFLDKFSRDAPSTSLSVLSQKVRNLDDFSQ
jgi:SAM-dependent methyltransferase